MNNPRQTLLEAVRRGDVELLQQELENHPSLLVDIRGQSPPLLLLHEATKYRHLRMLRFLLSKDVEAARLEDSDGLRVLDLAVKIGDVRIVREILKAAPNLCLHQGRHGYTALHYAAEEGKTEILTELLKVCPDSITLINDHGQTALVLAATRGHMNAMNLLSHWREFGGDNWSQNFKFDKYKDATPETRNVLLVVAALIATVCFQAGFKSPVGDTPHPPKIDSSAPSPSNFNPEVLAFLPRTIAFFAPAAGYHITYLGFLFLNTSGLSLALSIIAYMTAGFPFTRELNLALFCMMSAYGFGCGPIIKLGGKEQEIWGYLLLALGYFMPLVIRGVAKVWSWCKRECLGEVWS